MSETNKRSNIEDTLADVKVLLFHIRGEIFTCVEELTEIIKIEQKKREKNEQKN